MLTEKICVKYGRRVHLSEASTLLFISEHTSIPVPKVYCAFTHSGRTVHYHGTNQMRHDRLRLAEAESAIESETFVAAKIDDP